MTAVLVSTVDGTVRARRPTLESKYFFKADSQAELESIRLFRAKAYAERGDVTIDDDLALDLRSLVFGITDSKGVVTCFRALPLPDEGAGFRRFELFRNNAIVSSADCEIGRVAVRSSCSPRMALLVIGLSARWIAEFTDYRRYVAYCVERLLPLYVRAGAVDCGVTATRRSGEASYRLLAGRFDETAAKSLALAGNRVCERENR